MDNFYFQLTLLHIFGSWDEPVDTGLTCEKGPRPPLIRIEPSKTESGGFFPQDPTLEIIQLYKERINLLDLEPSLK